MTAAPGPLDPVQRLLRALPSPQRRPPTPCPRCATPVRAHLAACPLCGEAVPGAMEGRLEDWRRRGVLEIAVIAVVLVVFVVCFLVVFAHR